MARPNRAPTTAIPPRIMAPLAGPGPTPITLQVNRQTYHLEVEPRRSLLDALRFDLGLTGAKRVCNLGECGACTVLADGRPIYSCLALALEYQNRSITTIEGLAVDGKLDPVQEAFIRCDAVQCGFCTPGQVLAVKALLQENPRPTDEAIQKALAGNLCRCGTYGHIRDAIRSLTEGAVSCAATEPGPATEYLVPRPGPAEGGKP